MPKKTSREQEKKLIAVMIEMYRSSKRREMSDDELDELLLYASKRIETCFYRQKGLKKPFCNVCPVHCYSKDMREKSDAVCRATDFAEASYSKLKAPFQHNTREKAPSEAS